MSAYPETVARGWFPIAASEDLGHRPLARSLMDRPLVAFRSQEGPRVFLDRCPHRNATLSKGRVRDGAIECPYHGWRFGADGRCTLTPGAETPANRSAETRPCIERAGLIWTTLADDPPPLTLPHPIEADGFDSFWWPVAASTARLVDAVENLLDPAHPHFLHPGIVRSPTRRRRVEVTVRTGAGFAEAAYIEDAQAQALMPRMLEGKRARSIGRFLPPAIGQLAFESDAGPRLFTTVYFTPETADRVRPFAHFATPKGLAPAWLKREVLKAFHRPVLAQDRTALDDQASNIARFGGPKYALGPLDFLLPSIQQLMAGETLVDSEERFEVEL